MGIEYTLVNHEARSVLDIGKAYWLATYGPLDRALQWEVPVTAEIVRAAADAWDLQPGGKVWPSRSVSGILAWLDAHPGVVELRHEDSYDQDPWLDEDWSVLPDWSAYTIGDPGPVLAKYGWRAWPNGR